MAEDINKKSYDGKKRLKIYFDGDVVRFGLKEFKKSLYAGEFKNHLFVGEECWEGTFATVPLSVYNSRIAELVGDGECLMDGASGSVRIKRDGELISLIEVVDTLGNTCSVGPKDFEIYIHQLS